MGSTRGNTDQAALNMSRAELDIVKLDVRLRGQFNGLGNRDIDAKDGATAGAGGIKGLDLSNVQQASSQLGWVDLDLELTDYGRDASEELVYKRRAYSEIAFLIQS